MSATALDTARLERFERKMLGVLNGAAVALMTSIGHRTGLFDVMSRMQPATSAAIAAAAGLDERYLREWLAAMVTGGVIDYDPEGASYALPREHAALLTRAARRDNVAATCQWVPALGALEDRVLECFERGGGMPRDAFARFHALAEEDGAAVVASLLDGVLPLVDGLSGALERGIDVLDVGCGNGRALNHLAAAFPRSRFTGYSMSGEGVDAARAEAEELRLGNVRFARRDAARVCHMDEFDLVTAFDTIHDHPRPDAALRRLAGALRADGVLLLREIAGSSHLEQDVGHPLGAFLYTFSCLHCLTVSLAAGGPALGAMWGAERARKMLHEAGLARVEVRQLPRDAAALYFVARK
ncbi:MAG TPA: class I SAM-dependent methyltransferase [Myxococcota bacterium]|nr:class I SAM-dependent methyltransferase [Myxococcota bacterium]